MNQHKLDFKEHSVNMAMHELNMSKAAEGVRSGQ